MLQGTVASVIFFLGALAGSTDTARLFADEPLNKNVADPNAEQIIAADVVLFVTRLAILSRWRSGVGEALVVFIH